MKDERKGFLSNAAKGVLRVLSWLYECAVRTIDHMYRSGIRKQYSASIPVISIGNLTLGGTGKTPFAVFLADYFLKQKKRPAILTRGYGNDETRMLEDVLADVRILKGKDRVKNAGKAASEGLEVIILDDGFQHRKLKKDLNIVLLNAFLPFGNKQIFPRGILREPVSALKRADIAVLTKTNRVPRQDVDMIVREIEDTFPDVPVVLTQYNLSSLTDITGEMYTAEMLSDKKVCLISAIADPDYFAYLTEKQGADIVLRYDYPDHYAYKQKDIDRIGAVCSESEIDLIVTTSKDLVKIKDLDISSIEDKFFICNIAVEISENKERLNDRLNSINFS